MPYIRLVNSASDIFLGDMLGTFSIDGVSTCGYLSYVGRRSTLDRFLALLHKGDSFYADGRLIHAFEKGYRVFRRPFQHGYYRAVVVPSGFLMTRKETDYRTEEEKSKDPLDAYPPVRSIFVSDALEDQDLAIWQRIARLSPIPILESWRDRMLPIFRDAELVNTIRIQQGLPSIPGDRLSFLQKTGPHAESSPMWGAYLDIPVSDIAAIAQHLVQGGRLDFASVA